MAHSVYMHRCTGQFLLGVVVGG